jgi:hypothetical protein
VRAVFALLLAALAASCSPASARADGFSGSLGVTHGGFVSPGGAALPSVDFTAQRSSYAHLTYARSGGNVEGSNGANATQVFAANVPVWEDRGDGYGGGLVVAGGWTNAIASPNDFSAAQWILGAGATYTAPPVAGGLGPDGATQAASIGNSSPSSGHGYLLQVTPGGATSGRQSVWYKNDQTTPPTAPGGWETNNSYPVGANFASSAVWLRASQVLYIGQTSPYAFIWPSGVRYVNAPTAIQSQTWDSTQSGNIDAHGAQVAIGQTFADVPLGYGTIGATSAKVDSSVVVNAAGDFFASLDVSPLFDASSFYSTSINPAIEDGYLVSLPCAAGLFALRYTAATGVFVVTANGADVLTTAGTGVGSTQIGFHSGDRVLVTLVDAPSLGVGGLALSVNGAQGDPATFTPTGGALVPTDGMYLGSNVGATYWGMRVGVVTQLASSATPFARSPQGVCFGDSITAATDALRMTPATMLSPLASKTHAPIAVMAIGGEPIQTQQAKWDLSPLKTGPPIGWAIIRTGTNELQSGETAATIASAIEALIVDILGVMPSCKIFVSMPFPNWGALSAPQQTQWTALGVAIPLLTGIAGVLTTGTAACDNGSHSIAPALNLGDNEHPNDAGRAILAAGDVTDMAAAGVTP